MTTTSQIGGAYIIGGNRLHVIHAMVKIGFNFHPGCPERIDATGALCSVPKSEKSCNPFGSSVFEADLFEELRRWLLGSLHFMTNNVVRQCHCSVRLIRDRRNKQTVEISFVRSL